MNKDLIIKLAKLANNNPNENEANAAARKVCRLLAEANFKFTDDPVTPPIRPFNPYTTGTGANTPPYNPYQGVDWGFDFEKWAKDFEFGTKKKQTDNHIKRCIHCRKMMTTVAEIANKICAECWRKEREKFGL